MRVKYYNQDEVDFINKTFGRTITLGKNNKVQLNEYQKRIFLGWRINKSEIDCVTKEMNDSNVLQSKKDLDAFNDFLELQKQTGKYELYNFAQCEITDSTKTEDRQTVAILQLGDQHIDEVVKSETVMGLNEYNLEIAEQRQKRVYRTAAKLIGHHQKHYNIREVVILFGGDCIGNWIHPELEQTNSLSPNEAIHKFKGMTIAGLRYLHDNLDVDKIRVICISGNHPRETKKVQFNNFSEMNKEYWMYLDIQQSIEALELNKFEWHIPRAEMAVFNIFGKNYLSAHGHQFKYAGGVGGIFPSMFRWFGNINRNLNIKTAFIFHYHQSILTNKVIVNGTPKGFDAFALGHGFEYEKPSQNLILLDSHFGICNFQPIFL